MATKTPSFNDNKSSNSFLIGRVKNVILSETDEGYSSEYDIGAIQYEILYAAKSIPNDKPITKPAYPIFKFLKQYPLLGEIVLIFAGPSSRLNDSMYEVDYYYFPSYALWGSVNHNAFPNMQEYAEYLKTYYSQPGYNYDTNAPIPEMPIGTYFQENTVKSLRPFEGDTLLEGRFGQSIRFGSTNPSKKTENTWSNSGTEGNPITIIRNGEGKSPINSADLRVTKQPWNPIVENINYDDSSIYLTSGQSIVIDDLVNFPIDSFGTGISIVNSGASIVTLDRNPISNDAVAPNKQDNKALS